jgi:heterodisulfide reductase subunit B
MNHLLDFSELLKLYTGTNTYPRKLNLRDVHNLVLFESCCGSSHYPGIERSSKYVLDNIGIRYRTYEEQTCCGGFAYYANDIGLNELALINARNQSLISNEAAVISFNCTSCFSTNLITKRLLSEERNRSQINKILAELDREVKSNLYMAHFQQVLYDNIELIKDKLKLDFSGFRVATHSGCHYRHFNQITEDIALDELVGITGAKVIDYPLKDRCCGGGFEKSFVGEIDKVRKINYDKQYNIADSGADLVVVNCPGCEMTFDRNSGGFDGIKPFDMGYLHVAEFLALAMGADPFEVAGIQYHTSYLPLVKKFGL